MNQAELLQRRELIKALEAMALAIASNLGSMYDHVLSQSKEKCMPDISITVTRTQSTAKDLELDENKIVQRKREVVRHTCYSHGKPRSRRMFTVYLVLLAIVHGNLCDNVVCTKRDIYYRNTALFKTQSTVDSAIDNLAATFKVPRRLLNVSAAGKGLMYGNASVLLSCGTTLSAKQSRKGTHIPAMNSIVRVDLGSCKYVLVIEKEASFCELVPVADTLPVLLVCGKGYPDVVTREFLNHLHFRHVNDFLERPSVLALTDADPHGLEIALCYQSGSLALAHFNKKLACPSLQLKGVSISYVIANLDRLASGMIRLSLRDRTKAREMLSRVWLKDSSFTGYRKELQRLLFLGCKAELEIFSSFTSELTLPQFVRALLAN